MVYHNAVVPSHTIPFCRIRHCPLRTRGHKRALQSMERTCTQCPLHTQFQHRDLRKGYVLYYNVLIKTNKGLCMKERLPGNFKPINYSLILVFLHVHVTSDEMRCVQKYSATKLIQVYPNTLFESHACWSYNSAWSYNLYPRATTMECICSWIVSLNIVIDRQLLCAKN